MSWPHTRRDYVKKIAVYRERVAVQLPNKVVLYEVAPGGDELDMQYKSGGKIHQKLECNLLVVTSAHLTLCQVCGVCQGCREPGVGEAQEGRS